MDSDDGVSLSVSPAPASLDHERADCALDVGGQVTPSFRAQPVPVLSWLGLSVSVPLQGRFRRCLSWVFGGDSGRKKRQCFSQYSDTGSSEAEDLSRFKPLLSSIEGEVSAGEILYIMGGSGAGKSMLLDALADRLRLPVRGQTHLFGLPKVAGFNGLCRYVEQDDTMFSSLSCRETLEYAAAFAGVPSTELEGVVDHALQVLGLESVAKIRVGGRFFRGLSGGQRRRLAVGCQLVTKPTLLLCDEVMSGLDSHAACQVMRHLRDVADAGSAVIVTVHTPTAEMFGMSDNLCLLSRGRVAYFGPSAEVEAYFTNTLGYTLPPRMSVAEWVVSLCNGDFSASTASVADDICSVWPGSDARVRLLSRIAGRDVGSLWDTAIRASMVSGGNVIPAAELDVATAPDRASVAELRRGCACSVWTQMWLLTKRSLVDTVRNPEVMWLRLAVHLGLALIIGLAWTRRATTTAAHLFDLLGLLFFVQAFFVQASLSVLPVYVEEREIVTRERANRQYVLVSFMAAHLLVEAVYLAVLAVSAGTIIFFLCGLNPLPDRYLFFIAIQWLSLMVTESLVLLIAAMTPVMLVGLAATAFILSLFTVVQGFVIRMENLGPVRLVRWVSFHGFALGAMFANEFRGRTFPASPDTWPPYPDDVNGDEFMESFQFPTTSRAVAVSVLAGMVVFYRIAAFVWIWTFHNGKK